MRRGSSVHGRGTRAKVPAVERAENPEMGADRYCGRSAGSGGGGHVDLALAGADAFFWLMATDTSQPTDG